VIKCALLIINAKSKDGTLDIERAIETLKNSGIRIIRHEASQPEDICRLIFSHHQQVDYVILGGGDGTMNAAAAALVETGLPLGILPMGTANDLARTLKIPFDIESAANIIAQGVLHRIDLGTVNEKYFFNIANIGIGVDVKKNLDYKTKQYWGILSYVRGLIKAAKTFRPFRAEIICDEKRWRVSSIQIAVGNGRHYGGGMTISEHARIDDGYCFFYSVKPLSVWEFLRFALVFRSGNFKRHHPVVVDQGRHIEVATHRPMAVTADGELVTYTPAKFTVCNAAVKVLVPPSYLEELKESDHAASR
jgi:YegS/Rv2252/BmrU family lipid kinase